jgi:hypothetical protein
MVRQIAPKVAYQADTLFYPDPEGMEKKTKQLEAQQIALAEVEAAAKQALKDASQEQKRLNELKRR